MAATGNDNDYLLRVSLANYIIDVTLGITSWLNASTLCSFPQPWFERRVKKFQLPDSSVPYAKNVSAYLGVYANKAYGNMEVFFNRSLGRIVLSYGYGEWALYPIKGPADTFYGEGIGITYVKHCHTFVFRSGRGQLTTRIEAICFEMKLPPVFVREGHVNRAHAPFSLATRTLALTVAIITTFCL